jgi:hypothetical protein
MTHRSEVMTIAEKKATVESVAKLRLALCDIMEEAGGIATRLKEAEDSLPEWDDVHTWFKGIEYIAENAAILAAKMEAFND